MNNPMEKAAEMIRTARHAIALTGAGISVESGIPDFRSPGGLWAKYDPFVYAHIDSFHTVPEQVWEMVFDMMSLVDDARPNPGHVALAELEQRGLLKAIITQNIDNLHQEAGSINVIEYHGNASRLECLRCGERYASNDFDRTLKKPPVCGKCGAILKPEVVFFGEMIPPMAMSRSQELAQQSDVVLVVGTSAMVYPAAGLPYTAKQHGAAVIEFNVESTELTRQVTDVFVQGKAGVTLKELAALLFG